MAIASVVLGENIDPTTFGNAVVDFINNIQAAKVDTAQTTASATYVDLATVGPSVTCVTGTTALCMVSSLFNHSVINNTGMISVAVSGATTLAAADARSVFEFEPNVGNSSTLSGLILLTGLTAGSNTFTAKYRTTAATATFTYRTLAVIPLA
jgi:hypothetical protein